MSEDALQRRDRPRAKRGDASWASNWRQRLRLYPLFAAVRAADAWGKRLPRLQFRSLSPWSPGLTVIIPERDSPELLAEALAGVELALQAVNEARQVIVVVNGAAADRYSALRERHPGVEWQWHAAPLGFSSAISAGLRSARFDWTVLVNSDVVLDAMAVSELARHRDDATFAIAAQIEQTSSSGRREETGFVDWYVDRGGLRVFHAEPGSSMEPRAHLCASGGASLFRTALLRRYADASVCYDPAYWEDVEWGVRAWREGYRVMFAPAARARHRHRATTSRFFSEAQLAALVERNRLLFDARNAASGEDAETLMARVCQLPYASQRDCSAPALARAVFAARLDARRLRELEPAPDIRVEAGDSRDLAPASFSYRMRSAERDAGDATSARPRPRVLVVTPFAIFPPRHGGARRSAGLIGHLRRDFDIVLLSDEASLYDARSFAFFDGLHAVTLAERGTAPKAAGSASLGERMRLHAHAGLRAGLRRAVARYRPDVVHVEHIELAELVTERRDGERWLLGLHDAYGAGDFGDAAASSAFRDDVLARYDAVTVCSAEDAMLVEHPFVSVVPNGSDVRAADYVPSAGAQMIFMGPFRYRQNLEGVRSFLRHAYPQIRRAVPECTLLVLGGDAAPECVSSDPLFVQPGVRVVEHRDDAEALLRASALSINPLVGIRGSAIKLVESLLAGRVCISTRDGARGFAAGSPSALRSVDDVPAIGPAAVELLTDSGLRHSLEAPAARELAEFTWERCAERQATVYARLLEAI